MHDSPKHDVPSMTLQNHYRQNTNACSSARNPQILNREDNETPIPRLAHITMLDTESPDPTKQQPDQKKTTKKQHGYITAGTTGHGKRKLRAPYAKTKSLSIQNNIACSSTQGPRSMNRKERALPHLKIGQNPIQDPQSPDHAKQQWPIKRERKPCASTSTEA